MKGRFKYWRVALKEKGNPDADHAHIMVADIWFNEFADCFSKDYDIFVYDRVYFEEKILPEPR